MVRRTKSLDKRHVSSRLDLGGTCVRCMCVNKNILNHWNGCHGTGSLCAIWKETGTNRSVSIGDLHSRNIPSGNIPYNFWLFPLIYYCADSAFFTEEKMFGTVKMSNFGRTLIASLLVWLDFASCQLACLPPGRYFATAPGGPAPPPVAPMPGFFAAAAPAMIPPGCVPVVRPAALPAFAPSAAPVAAMPAMPAAMPAFPVLRTAPGFMPAAAFPAYTPAAAFPGLTPAVGFGPALPSASIPFHTPAAAFPGFLPTYSPSVAIPAASAVFRTPVSAFPCFPVIKKRSKKMAAEPFVAKLRFRRGISTELRARMMVENQT